MRAQAGSEHGLRSPADSHPGMGFREFVALMAALMAVNALSIDIMLPVLPHIGESLEIVLENDQQWVVTAFLLGFGTAQLVYGPLSDHFGRRVLLLAGLAIFVVFSLAAAFAASLQMMIVARACAGAGAAATRVLAISIIRDCYAGRRMARVMSLVFIVFLTAPVLAPALGETIAVVAPWQWIFAALAVFGTTVATWAALRLPETLNPADARAVSPAGLLQALRLVVTNRIAFGYMLASTAIFGSLFGFITSAQQIFAEALQAPELFTTVFALVAGCMAVASFINSRIVERVGMRRVSHGALLGYIAISGAHALVALSGNESLWIFAAFQAATLFCFGMVGVNFNSMAMEPLGAIAGTGSSVLGAVTTVGGALIGFYVGQQFDGTVIPLTIGFTACGLAALGIVLLTERGRLFLSAGPSEAEGLSGP
jgi:MFS transporter, DHA1 family, multidrug resistance protein